MQIMSKFFLIIIFLSISLANEKLSVIYSFSDLSKLLKKFNSTSSANYTDSRQIILVIASDIVTSDAVLTAYEKKNNKWMAIYSNIPVTIGRNGLSREKREGDGKSPSGVYNFLFMFGTAKNPGIKYEYRLVTGNQYWVDDISSDLYNTWQEGPVLDRWKSAEKLDIKDYKYATVMSYNTHNIVKGKGSAIFMHLKTKDTTSGCTSLKEDDLLKILKWLDPNKHPLIAQGYLKDFNYP